MGFGISLVLIAIGAIVTGRVHSTVVGVDVRVVGALLLAAGLAGLPLSWYFRRSYGRPIHIGRRGGTQGSPTDPLL